MSVDFLSFSWRSTLNQILIFIPHMLVQLPDPMLSAVLGLTIFKVIINQKLRLTQSNRDSTKSDVVKLYENTMRIQWEYNENTMRIQFLKTVMAWDPHLWKCNPALENEGGLNALSIAIEYGSSLILVGENEEGDVLLRGDSLSCCWGESLSCCWGERVVGMPIMALGERAVGEYCLEEDEKIDFISAAIRGWGDEACEICGQSGLESW